jgi:XTP/dITP diphosphohydrolase
LTLLLATRNPKKARELIRLIKLPGLRLLTLDRFPEIPLVHEDGATFRANAVKKAVQTSRYTILTVLAEDSGLEVRALGGRPGVRSARFAGNDEANIEKLLRLMSGVSASKRQARFVCCIALAIGGTLIRTFQAHCAGRIGLQPAGRTGFGYDPIFIPSGYRKTFAQLGAQVKDRLSHRCRAAGKLRRYLSGFLRG